ncbi:flagellin [Oceanobacillus oncorhynchi subsp. oncorhynchi]|uniref:flagellin N-terminal helical domain-containing protein n=1 Tax=Oceanobacillus oncorhynchi TaxID=545501 RepID=UPI003637B249
MIINHNISAINAHRQLGVNQNGVQGSLEKLSSGLQINRAGDDAAGLAISEKMRGQIRGLEQASTNAQDGISLIQTAEGALNETHDILQRMRELAVQASNDTNTESDRAELQKEVNQLSQEITRIAENTEFNTQNLLGGDLNVTFHIGANEGQNISIGINAMDAHSLGVTGEVSGLEESTAEILGQSGTDVLVSKDADGNETIHAVEIDGDYYRQSDVRLTSDGNALEAKTGAVALTHDTEEVEGVTYHTLNSGSEQGIDISTQEAADIAITTINNAIETVSGERSKLGSVQNRLEHTINNLGTSAENLTAAESRIRDVDYDLAA